MLAMKYGSFPDNNMFGLLQKEKKKKNTKVKLIVFTFL